MPYTPITPVYTPVAAAIGSPAAPAAGGKESLGKDAFLKLLVAQLKYQDPSNPTDSSQFMSQTAQFTQVEKLDAIAKSMTEMLTAQSMFSTSSLIGKTVTYIGPDGKDVSGVVSSASFSSSGPLLRVGTANTEVAVSAVKEVSQGAISVPAVTTA